MSEVSRITIDNRSMVASAVNSLNFTKEHFTAEEVRLIIASAMLSTMPEKTVIEIPHGLAS